MKYLNFTLTETYSRTFEIPMDKVQELIKEHNIEPVDFDNEEELASLLGDVDTFKLNEIATYETDNHFVDNEVCWNEFIEK